jgi:hypothetical protein
MKETPVGVVMKLVLPLDLTSFISGRRLKTIQIILMDMIMFSSQNNAACVNGY